LPHRDTSHDTIDLSFCVQPVLSTIRFVADQAASLGSIAGGFGNHPVVIHHRRRVLAHPVIRGTCRPPSLRGRGRWCFT
jgi:hypothetical protein